MSINYILYKINKYNMIWVLVKKLLEINPKPLVYSAKSQSVLLGVGNDESGKRYFLPHHARQQRHGSLLRLLIP